MKVIETFNEVAGYLEMQIIKKEPSCFNGNVDVVKYKVTIEKIEETKEVYQQRLQKLWDECNNHHHWHPLNSMAKTLGVELIGHSGGKPK